MSRFTEFQKAIEELATEEKEELRDWLGGYDPATESEWAAIAQERIRQIESEESNLFSPTDVQPRTESIAAP